MSKFVGKYYKAEYIFPNLCRNGDIVYAYGEVSQNKYDSWYKVNVRNMIDGRTYVISSMSINNYFEPIDNDILSIRKCKIHILKKQKEIRKLLK